MAVDRDHEFGPDTAVDEVLSGIDLRGKRFVVTGAAGSIGHEIVRALASRGATVIAAVRDVEQARSTLEALGDVVPRYLDLGSITSALRFAAEINPVAEPVDGLIGCAGVMACPFELSVDGYERQFATNHLGHFALIRALGPALVNAAPSRIVLVSSAGHAFGDVDLDDINFVRREYDPHVAYGRSKTANVLCAVELDRRMSGRGVRAVAVHPGMVFTDIFRHVDPDVARQRIEAARTDLGLQMKTPAEGAATAVWAATVANPDLVGGRYCQDCAVAEPTDDARARPGVMRYAMDPERARQLWDLSSRMVDDVLVLTHSSDSQNEID